MHAILILILLATAGRPPLPDFPTILTLTAGKDTAQKITHDREDELTPGQVDISCDAAGNCTGSIYGPTTYTAHDTTSLHYVWMHADGWNILLICREGWGNRCAPLTENAEYDVRKWRGTAEATAKFSGDSWTVTMPDAVELVPKGKKKPKVSYEISSMFKILAEGEPGEPRQIIFIDRDLLSLKTLQ